jgi:hypothetical protein
MLNTHAHSRHPIVAPRCLRSSHHPRPCLTLTPVCCNNVQCRMHRHLHKDWVHNCVLWLNHSMQSQVHTDGTMDDFSNSMEPCSPHRFVPYQPALHYNDRKCRCHLFSSQICPLCASTSLFLSGGNTSPRTCNKHQANHYSGSHSSIDLVPSPTFHGHQQSHMRRHHSCTASTHNNNAVIVLA